MRKIVFFCTILLLIPRVALKAGAQETNSKQSVTAAPAQPVHYYHFDFVVENLDAAGKVVNSRSYSTTVDTESHALTSIRTGSRIPIVTGSIETKPAPTAEFQYVDVGVDLDIRDVHEVGRQLAFDLTANLSGEASPAQPGQDPNHPVIRQNRWASRVLVPIGKRTVVFTSDSLDSKGSTSVAVTATPIED
ncbi:MAG TPA: hypothetical protein VFW94_15970 [Candidatus Acidoferrales bacterium]|nr:hypothetical protein [Candidatus Acidoferrales bacterium]